MKLPRRPLCVLTLAILASAVQAQELSRPGPEDATRAVLAMMNIPEVGQAGVRVGTCVEPLLSEHEGQIACTVLVSIGAGSSETQADFYRENGEWVAQPSESQSKLPFPDPALNE